MARIRQGQDLGVAGDAGRHTDNLWRPEILAPAGTNTSPRLLQAPFLPSLELLSLVKNPNPKRFGDWSSGKDHDKLGTQWQRLCVLESQLGALLDEAA